MKKVLLLLLVSIMTIAQTIAQGTTNPPQIFPPTPQSQIFEKYINHAVTEYNGLPQINIPLYVMEIKGLKIPISLSYHAAGIKYKEYDGDVGAGWSINAGGYRVSRSIFGKPDELYRLYNADTLAHYLNDRHIKDAYLAGIASYDAHEIMKQIDNNIYRDGEYDQFTYMLPTSNGQFLIADRATKSIAMVNPNQDKIILDEGSSSLLLNDIKLIDNNGFEYYAGGMQGNNTLLAEKSRANGYFKTSWPVSKIKSPYNEIVDFKYDLIDVNMSKENHYIYTINDATILDTYNFFWSPPKTTNHVTHTDPEEISNIVEKMYFVSEIKSEKETVKFYRATGIQTLERIEVTNNIDGSIFNIYFEYVTSGSHQLLNKVVVNGKAYTFDYFSPPVQLNDAFPDQWGYYKYPNTSGDSWGLSLHEEFKDDYYVHIYNYPLHIRTVKQIKDHLELFNVGWLNRTTNDNVSYFSLKTIHFPTGGITTYEYEPNQYKESYYNDPNATIIKGGGQRVKQIISRPKPGDIPVITRFKYGENEDGNGTVDYEFIRNIKNRYANESYFFSFIPTADFWTLTTSRTYSPKPLDGDIDITAPIEYAKVTTYAYDSLGNTVNGKTIANYTIPYRFYLNAMSVLNMTDLLSNESTRYSRYVSTYNLGKEPGLTSRLVYNKDNELVKKEEFTYADIFSSIYNGVKVKQKVFFNPYPLKKTFSVETFQYMLTDSYFQQGNTAIQFWGKLPLTKTVTSYENGTNPLAFTENYEYNSNQQLVKTSSTNSNGELLSTALSYPTNTSGTVYTEMVNRNIVAPIIEEIKKNGTTEVSIVKTNYTNDMDITTGLILPHTVATSYTGSANLQTEITYNKYDIKGNLLQYTKLNGAPTAYLWSYKYKYPVAEIVNASYADVSTALAINGLTVTALAAANAPDMVKINALRSGLSDAKISTYTYYPMAGIASVSDVKGLINYYEYDDFLRLKNIKNQYGFIIKNYCYNYAGQIGNCSSIQTFYNTEKKQFFTRNNCSPGQTGTILEYIIPPGAFQSTVSQAAADALAAAALASGGQAYANSNGTCTPVQTCKTFKLTVSPSVSSNVYVKYKPCGSSSYIVVALNLLDAVIDDDGNRIIYLEIEPTLPYFEFRNGASGPTRPISGIEIEEL